MKKKTRNIVIVIAACAVVLGAGAAAYVAWVAGSGAVREEASIYIPRGADFRQLTDSLDAHGGLRFESAFKAYANRIGLSKGEVKPGHYMLKKGMNIIDVARMFNLGNQTPVNVVIRTSRIPGQIAARVGAQIETDSTALRWAMNDPGLLKELGFGNELELMSVFIPDTYELWWTVTADDFLRRMKREYDRFWTEARLQRLERTGLTKMEVMTLASIIAEETNKTDEMPVMAGVYINRLRKGMALQACPTVKYALGDFGLRRILTAHTKVDSPYNTYQNKGLPPTPICTPAPSTIDAVLNFDENDYYYFCAKEDLSGYHNFAETYQQHMENSRRYSKMLNERNL